MSACQTCSCVTWTLYIIFLANEMSSAKAVVLFIGMIANNIWLWSWWPIICHRTSTPWLNLANRGTIILLTLAVNKNAVIFLSLWSSESKSNLTLWEYKCFTCLLEPWVKMCKNRPFYCQNNHGKTVVRMTPSLRKVSHKRLIKNLTVNRAGFSSKLMENLVETKHMGQKTIGVSATPHKNIP